MRPTISLHVGVDAKGRRFGADGFEGAMQRRLLGVDEIHRHLRLAVDLETERLDVAQAARRAAHGLGDLLWRPRRLLTRGPGTRCRRRGMDERQWRRRRRSGGSRADRSRARVRGRCGSRRAGPRTRRAARRPGSRDRGGSPLARRGRRGSTSSRPTRSPSVRASATQSSIVAPSRGTKGTTSVAPMRGCAPWCVWRSISDCAVRMPANAASTAVATGATNVTTVRLCDVSDDTSRIVTCGTAAIASRIWRMISGRRPSEKLGTHSTSVMAGRARESGRSRRPRGFATACRAAIDGCRGCRRRPTCGQRGRARPARSVTTPPASRTSRMPAAMSQGASINSQNPSNRPHATSAQIERGGPGAPQSRRLWRLTAANCGWYSASRSRCENGKPVPMSARDGW